MVSTIKHWLWDSELKVSEGFRPFSNAYAVGYAAFYAVVFVPIFFSSHFSLLGPGLGEPVSWGIVQQELRALHESSQAGGYASFYYAVLILLGTAILMRAGIGLRGYFKYRGERGEKFPLNDLWVWTLVNQIGVAGLVGGSVLVAIAVMLAGGQFMDGLLAIDAMSSWANQQVDVYIPTLVELPSWAAIFLIYISGAFVHYWAHRLGHQLRAGWLLFHRVHHMPRILSVQTTTPVFFAIPLLLVVVVPYNFVFGSVAKLFSAEPLYVEAAIIMSLNLLVDPWSHATALYQESRQNKFLRFWGWLFCSGVYHAMHHSTDVRHAGRSGANNLVNIGGFGFLCLWDRVFGTFVEPSKEVPPMGLTGDVELHMNPFRLALSGLAQIAYELWANKSWKDRFWILFGGSDWSPPITRDFAVKSVSNRPA